MVSIGCCTLVECIFFSISDVPSEGVYMVCGVLIAMVLVAVIIVVLAVTIRYVWLCDFL